MEKFLNIIKKIIRFIFFRPDMHFIHILPNNFASVVTYKNLINNYFYYVQQKKIKRLLLIKFRLFHKIFIDSLKILYLPISIIFYFFNFRFF